MTRPFPLILALLLTAAGPASAFVRTTANEDGTGPALHWNNPAVHYSIHDFSQYGAIDVCGAPGSPSAALAAVQAGFSAWSYGGADTVGGEVACTGFHFVFDGATTDFPIGNDGRNQVVFRRGSCSNTSIVPSADSCHSSDTCADKYNCWDQSSSSIIALTTSFFRSSTGEVVDADMELNAWDGVSTSFSTSGPFYFTCVDPEAGDPPANACSAPGDADCIRIDVQNTVTHEAGHALGLAHNCYLAGSNSYGAPLCTAANQSLYEPATMYPSAPPHEVSKRALSQDDIDGVCAAYPISSGGGGGCSHGPGSLTSLLGVLGLLALRRRQ